MRRQRTIWGLVLRLSAGVTLVSSLLVIAAGWGLWVVEGGRPDGTLRSWGDAMWWSLCTLTTVGYGDHVPVTTAGRVIGAAVMVAGIAVIGAVAAIVSLAVTLRVAAAEEQALGAQAGQLERRLEVRLDRIEAQLARLDVGRQTGNGSELRQHES